MPDLRGENKSDYKENNHSHKGVKDGFVHQQNEVMASPAIISVHHDESLKVPPPLSRRQQFNNLHSSVCRCYLTPKADLLEASVSMMALMLPESGIRSPFFHTNEDEQRIAAFSWRREQSVRNLGRLLADNFFFVSFSC